MPPSWPIDWIRIHCNALERLLPLYSWKHGLKGYEYWGTDWYTHNPFEWGIHTVHF